MKHEAIAISLLTALLYLNGFAHHEGYLEIYGLDSSQFPIASDRALFSGFITFSIKSMVARLVSISILLILFILFLKYLTPYSLNFYLHKYLAPKSSAFEYSVIKQHPLLTLIWYGSLFFTTIFAFILIAMLAYSSGTKQATDEQREYKELKSTTANLIYKLNENEKMHFNNAKLITCNTVSCAYWIKKDKLEINEKDIFESHILQLDKIGKISILTEKNK
jgi:hypothetical protein